MIKIVTYGWGIFIVFMVSILLLAAIGMLYLLRSLYPFSSKYEIACVIACGIVMILSVLFSVYGVKKLAAPERQVETRMRQRLQQSQQWRQRPRR